MKTCKDCSNFVGAGDWNLCCKNPPERAKESWCGFLCYEDTEVCENFNISPDLGWTACKDCINFKDCENKEARDGCYFGEVEDEGV
jgi:hypothetical protein